MSNDGTINFCPIEQKIRDSSVLFALQQLHGDAGGETQFQYTFDDIPTQNDHHQMRYWIMHPELNMLLGAGMVTTDLAMTRHLIYTILPIESQAVFLTEDYFTND